MLNELEGTEWGQIEYGLNQDDPVGYYCQALLGEKGVEVYGVRPMATKLRRIELGEIKSGFLSDGGEHLLGHAFKVGGSREVLFENLHIRRNIMKRFLKVRKTSQVQ